MYGVPGTQDSAQGVDTFEQNREKIRWYRNVVAQGDKVLSRWAMYETGYKGLMPPNNVKVGGPVTPSTLNYQGQLNWQVVGPMGLIAGGSGK